ncbi:hypothetical protein CC80DRAFT_234699 [Byssothecium circinans]|uniref:Uncharacterized protein n=1 Tax=Byssothecium circinans TaxID=147558 RepID=A0A6A5U8M2_9PLEO|nr:hypothetical protein CC80DRAFT_234699 [Byssothecium circinans]
MCIYKYICYSNVSSALQKGKRKGGKNPANSRAIKDPSSPSHPASQPDVHVTRKGARSRPLTRKQEKKKTNSKCQSTSMLGVSHTRR